MFKKKNSQKLNFGIRKNKMLSFDSPYTLKNNNYIKYRYIHIFSIIEQSYWVSKWTQRN